MANPATVLARQDEAVRTAFNLNDAVRALYEQTHIADPGEFADALLASLPPEHLRVAARAALREFVRVWFSRERLRAPLRDEDDTDAAPAVAGRPNQRYAGLVDELLRQSVSVEGNRWLQFGACTARDLAFLIAARRENAAKSIAKAKFYERVKDEVDRRGAPRVSDLPSEILQSLAMRGGEK